MGTRRIALVNLFLPAILAAASACLGTDTWETLMPGVQHLHRTTSDPLNIHVLIIDLTNPRVKMRAGLKNDNDKPDDGETVRSICRRYNAVAGINCDYFSATVTGAGDHRHIPQGHNMTDGLLMLPPGHSSPIVPDRSALAFPADNSYGLVNVFSSPLTWWWNVVAGGPRIIRNGVVGWEVEPDIPDQTSRQPRTGAALTSNYRTLILATVDGRQPGFSIGVTANQLGEILKEFGGHNGLSFDGGGSTTMVINGETVNSPSDGSDRRIANCLMVLDKTRQGNGNVLFESGFENPPYSPGTLGGQNGWAGSGAIVSGGRGAGQCALFSGAGAYRNVSPAPTPGVQWFECWVKCSSTGSTAYIYSGTTGCASVGSAIRLGGGQIQAYDTDELGSPVWTVVGTYAANTWYRIHVRLDYNISRYQVFVNGVVKLSGASFMHPGASAGLQAIKFEEIGGGSSLFVDDVYVGGADPDFLRVSPDSLCMVRGAVKQFRTLGGSPPVTWSIVDEKYQNGSPAPPGAIAQITADGLVTAAAPGSFAVQAQDGIGRTDKSGPIAVESDEPLEVVKAHADTAPVRVSGLVVSAVFDGFVYAQEPDRRSGIRIATNAPVAVGDQIWAIGTLGTVAGERVINASWLEVFP